MRGPNPPEIKLTPRLEKILNTIARSYTIPYWLVTRAKIILYAAAGIGTGDIEGRLDIEADTVGKWRKRWFEAEPRLVAVDAEGLETNSCRPSPPTS